VYKKAGIVVAAAAAGLLAVSPLAFAGDKDDHHHDGGDVHSDVREAGNNEGGLVNVADNETNFNGQLCNNDVSGSVAGGAVNEITGAIAGAAALEEANSEANTENNEVRDCALENTGGNDSAEVG
jgi:hypothetical protein